MKENWGVSRRPWIIPDYVFGLFKTWARRLRNTYEKRLGFHRGRNLPSVSILIIKPVKFRHSSFLTSHQSMDKGIHDRIDRRIMTRKRESCKIQASFILVSIHESTNWWTVINEKCPDFTALFMVVLTDIVYDVEVTAKRAWIAVG